MRWYVLPLAGAMTAGALSLFPAAPALAAGTASGSVYSFALAPANTAVSPSGGTMGAPGDWISVKGSGTFDPAADTVAAKGSFVHYSSTGAVVCKGTWTATGFSSFVDFGSNGQGDEGGVLSIVVTHYCTTMGMTMINIPMTVTSTVDAPVGSTYVEGTTVADFTQPTGGGVEIQPDQ
jgi:hypothetical protein